MPTYLELRVALQGIRPPIWRRFLIRSTGSFESLHHAIQDAFGWERCHLWEFREPGRRGDPIAGVPDSDGGFGWGPPTPDASKVRLSSYFMTSATPVKCHYTYDFGDSWEHLVTLRNVVTLDESFERRLLAGKRACPPEDCGGVSGYYRLWELLETGKDPYGDDPDELREWIGDWDPESFDLPSRKASFDR